MSNIKKDVNDIRQYVINNLKYKVSIHKIRKIHKEIIGNIPWKTGKNIYKFIYRDRHENYTGSDYIENDYKTTKKYQKFEMYATVSNESIVNNKSQNYFLN